MPVTSGFQAGAAVALRRLEEERSDSGGVRWEFASSDGGLGMPIYEFVCLDCSKEFSLVLSLHGYENKEFACPHCKSKRLESLITACSVVTSRKS
jgi:putative FmdB family regulatory protein